MVQIGSLCPLLQVFDMPASLRFYRDLLGFEIVQSSARGDDCDWCWLRLGSAGLMLNTAYERQHRPSAPDPARVEWHEDIALYFGCSDPDELYRHLGERGAKVEPPQVRDYGMKQLSLTDPDGYQLCFQCQA